MRTSFLLRERGSNQRQEGEFTVRNAVCGGMGNRFAPDAAPLLHVFALRTLQARIELVARKNAAGAKLMSIHWP